MKIYSNSIVNGYLGDAFGKYGTKFSQAKRPNRSFHIAWQDLPANTKSLALVFLDHDAIPVCGFTWIHWTVANIDPTLGELIENASVEMELVEGVTSWVSKILPSESRLNRENAIGYGGCAPPDKTHRYTIELYALDDQLDLVRGFYFNELLKAMENHMLAKATLHALYRSQ